MHALTSPSALRSAARLGALAFACSLIIAATAGSALADDRGTQRSGRLRAELWAGNTFKTHGGWLHHPYIAHAVDCEWMLIGRLAMSVRLLPALAYFGPNLVVGAALGVANRVYWHADGSGAYTGLAVAALLQPARFPENSSHLNFVSSFELGYQPQRSPFRVGGKLEHVSNAGLGQLNHGWNGIALLVGAEFGAR